MNLKSFLLRFWNLWPPFLFTGIKIVETSPDYRHLKVKLKLRFWNSNYLGTQYGGTMFSMTDPFYMIMLIKNLGPEFSIWDKSASIDYLKPGRTDLIAEFHIAEEDIHSIRADVEKDGKVNWRRKVLIKNLSGETVAEVKKTISIKKHGFKPAATIKQ